MPSKTAPALAILLTSMLGPGADRAHGKGHSGSEGGVTGMLKGTASYRERMALPPDAIFEATLEDVSRVDAPAEVIGRIQIDKPGNPPIPFEIRYDPSRIDARRRYTVRARILVRGQLLFTTDQHYPVLTGGAGEEVQLMLRRAAPVGPAAGAPGVAAAAPLESTYWKLTHLGDAPVTAADPQREPHLVLNAGVGRVGGSGGCNRLAGSYTLSGPGLSFGPLAGTMMACAQGMETEKAFFDALGRVARWRVAGQVLELIDRTGVVVARFEARPPQ